MMQKEGYSQHSFHHTTKVVCKLEIKSSALTNELFNLVVGVIPAAVGIHAVTSIIYLDQMS
jgi:hypothetical protein